MRVKLDALVAEFVREVDFDLREENPEFETLSKSHRIHLILEMLTEKDVARIEESTNSATVCWRPSYGLERYLGVKGHIVPDEYEEVEAPFAILTLAQEYSQALKAYSELKQTVMTAVQMFAMCSLGMLEYCGKRDGQCAFRATPDFEAKAEKFESLGIEHALMEVVGEVDGVLTLQPILA